MAPVVHAVVEANPEFDAASADLLACGSTFGNLLRFARGIDNAFRFNVEVIGETVFFIRKENDPKEVIEDVRGFGHTFPEAYTTWDHSVRGSETHQRIIRYEFGGLKCLMRFESDGCFRNAPAVSDTTPTEITVNQDNLLQAVQRAAISQSPDTTISKPDTIQIKHGGTAVPQQSIFDLKTRSGKHMREIDMNDMYPVLWAKQIFNFVVAYHDGGGLFNDIRVQNIEHDVQAWARDNKDDIRRFAALLEKIVDFARSNASKLLEVNCPGTGRLEIRTQYGDGVHALPADLVDRWAKTKMSVMSSQDDASDEFEHGDGGIGIDDQYDLGTDSDNSSFEPDFTACSARDCGYCGRCTY